MDYKPNWRRKGAGCSTTVIVLGTEARLSGFEPATTYEWWVQASNQYAVSDASAVWSFTAPSNSRQVTLGSREPIREWVRIDA